MFLQGTIDMNQKKERKRMISEMILRSYFYPFSKGHVWIRRVSLFLSWDFSSAQLSQPQLRLPPCRFPDPVRDETSLSSSRSLEPIQPNTPHQVGGHFIDHATNIGLPAGNILQVACGAKFITLNLRRKDARWAEDTPPLISLRRTPILFEISSYTVAISSLLS